MHSFLTKRKWRWLLGMIFLAAGLAGFFYPAIPFILLFLFAMDFLGFRFFSSSQPLAGPSRNRRPGGGVKKRSEEAPASVEYIAYYEEIVSK